MPSCPIHRVVRGKDSPSGKRGVPCERNGGNAPTSLTLRVQGSSPDQINEYTGQVNEFEKEK